MKKNKIPKESQKHIDFLSKYKINNKLEWFNIIHLYGKELAFPNGYYDSRFFKLVGFNTKTMEKRIFEHRDGLHFRDYIPIKMVRIYADGSTLIRFRKFVSSTILWSQDIEFDKIKKEA
jgi:hypothetical protein